MLSCEVVVVNRMCRGVYANCKFVVCAVLEKQLIYHMRKKDTTHDGYQHFFGFRDSVAQMPAGVVSIHAEVNLLGTKILAAANLC